ncbi:hypothetical protein GQX73_g4324 [Xylaria multiplex]|uniref:Nephrocystin 3-like N-terminal domain-containing protein n=1 Tax=Xylaria multiplex TaxID=323545 RepID=A0A7C8MS93_9PEZI|nr:hypothetical protein GQX73_g4324 [Xylaria multiplex]
MSPLHDRIPSVGLHVLYEPEKSDNTLIDIVFIHGFGGHPMRSWQCDDRITPVTRARADSHPRNRPLLRLLKRKGSSDQTNQSATGAKITRSNTWHSESNTPPRLFWPRDLLPTACPEARIILWGYHTLHSGNMPVVSQSDIFSHVEDLVRKLGELRRGIGVQQRPLIFIAHSIGGIVVKEIFRQAEFSETKSDQDILSSTAATIFFGCPHRAVEQEPLMDTVVSMAEASSSIQTESSVLSALCGVNNPRWGEAQESFVRIWNHFNFIVKTYQERQGDENGLINNRSQSSKLGDMREGAESLPGDHRTMCQFKSANDVGFISLSKILQEIVKDEKSKRRGLTAEETKCLLRFTSHQVHGSRSSAPGSSLGTCRSICNTVEFCDWYRRQGGSNEHIFWLTGAPGSGKSTQLRHFRYRIEKQWNSATTSIIYCPAESRSLSQVPVPDSKLGKMRSVTAIRSILSQLFAQDLDLRQRIFGLCDDTVNDADLTQFFLDDYIANKPRTLARRTFILVDAGDSCDDVYIRELLYCLSQMARNSNFSVCLASRLISGLVPPNITQLQLEKHNFEDISRQVQYRLRLATNLLNEVIDGGGAQDLVDRTLDELPVDLHGLYEWTLATLSPKEMADATTIMRWVMLSPEPMMLNDLQMAVRLSRTSFLLCCDPESALDIGLPWSMQELQKTGKQFDTPSQFYQWLCSRTRGLLEARPADGEGKAQQSLGLQHIYPINESVRSFFLSGRGFAALSSGRATTTPPDHEAVDLCHYSLFRTILTYLNTSDLSPLVSGHRLPDAKQRVLSPETSPIWRRNVVDQRNLITSSYPFLRYAVDNLLYHLLSPRPLRYFLPQHAIFRMFTSDNCRIWRRWTALLGETEASAILAKCKSAEALLQPEFGTSFRLERVFRAVNKMATGDSWFSPRRSLGLSVSPMFPIPPKSRTGVEAEAGAGAEAEAEVDEAARQKPTAPGPHLLPLPPYAIRRGPRSRGTVVVVMSGRR